MIEVTIDSIRVSLMSQHRIVILKETTSDRYLPIWIGPCAADAITVELQEVEVPRPLTHDLLKSVISQMGAEVVQVVINELRNDVYYARIVLDRIDRLFRSYTRLMHPMSLPVGAWIPMLSDRPCMR